MTVLRLSDVELSCLRWLLGFCVGGIFGFLLAALGRLGHVDSRGLAHILNFLRAIPILGLVPVVQMVSIDELGKIGLIAWGVMFPVWLSVRAADARSLEDAELRLLGARLDAVQVHRAIIWPRLFGGLIQGLEIGVGIGWLCVVAAELIGTYSTGFWAGGLGYRLTVNYQSNSWSGVFLILGVFGTLGLATAWIWKRGVIWLCGRMGGFNPIRWLEQG